MAKVLLAIALLLFINSPAVVKAESHWESYYVYVPGFTYTCCPYYYTFCVNWWGYGGFLEYQGCGCQHFQFYAPVCYTAIGYNCYPNCLGWILVQLWRCQNGWQGANCDIPICDNPSCTANQLCVAPNRCDCYRGPTGGCIYQPCDDGPNQNCYPGYCDKSGNPWKCVCPAGFSGFNCQTVTISPVISNCFVQVFGTPNGQPEQEVARANECAAQGLDPLPVWIGATAANSLTKIVVTWQAQNPSNLPLPGRELTPWILNAPVPIGIVETNFTVSFINSTTTPSSVYCIGPQPVLSNPPAIKQCTGWSKQWTDLGILSIIKTNTTFIVSIEAQLGGVKQGDQTQAGGRFTGDQPIVKDPNMNTTIRNTKFAFDLEPPYHCLSQSNNCTVFPIFLNQTMTNNPVIQPTFNQWNDGGSGLDRFHVDVYYLQPDSQGLLVPTDAPLVSNDINITLNNFRYTCLTPGAYSIVLTVYDKANNSAKARKIFNYDDHDSSFVETSSPIYLDKADPNANYTYITNIENTKTSFQFSLIWTGHFISSYNKDWLGAVRGWSAVSGGNVIDDNKGLKYGLRSIDAITPTGVLGYEIAYAVDRNGTGGYGFIPSNFVPIMDPTADRTNISVNTALKDGDTIIVWLKVYDWYGQPKTIISKTVIDSSRFNTKLIDQQVKKHYPDQFNTSVAVVVKNPISGIKNITYTIFDETKQLTVRTGVMFPVILEPPSKFNRKKRDSVTLPCTSTDPTCYCIPMGMCFNVTQLINIDNCWIDRVAGDDVSVSYTVYTMSGWSLDASKEAGTLNAEDIPCRSVNVLSRGAIIGICIASIIGFILLLLILILLILMLVRWKVYHRHPLPAVIRTSIHNTFGRNSISNVHMMSDNELYASKGEVVDPVKKSNESRVWANKLWDVDPGKSKNNSLESCLVSGKDLQIGNVIAEGRFAVIRKGFLTTGNERTPVAIKSLRSGYDKVDPEVMRTKIVFMANEVKPHPNIVKFMGAVMDDNDQEPPVMLLELCDKSLKDWLSEISKVDAEVLEDMLTFTLQIARGVEHLHDQKIIHRRLAVRNVMLKRTLSGYEAKLIGFGPSKESSDDRSDVGLSVVPLKWMAPETLDTLDTRKPTYDEKTDAWSYGVTVWEIYSKGEAPFAKHKSADIRTVLKRGERLTCPEDCPPDLFNQVVYPCWNASPKKRPNFAKICTAIELFRNGSSTSSGYYPTTPRAGAGSSPPPPGYYSASDALQNRNQPNNAGLYQDARSG